MSRKIEVKTGVLFAKNDDPDDIFEIKMYLDSDKIIPSHFRFSEDDLENHDFFWDESEGSMTPTLCAVHKKTGEVIREKEWIDRQCGAD